VAALLAGDLLPLLRCPVSGRPLAECDGMLVSDDGANAYEMRDGVPILLAPGRSVFDGDILERRSAGERSLGARLGARLSAMRSRNLAAEHACARLLTELRRPLPGDAGHDPRRRLRVLVIGGRIEGPGLSLLLTEPMLDLVETDVAFGPRTRIVCDAHDLPFANGSFDAVVAQAVMEHVLDPQRVAAEVHRVLAPGGLVYSDTPFVQQVHEGAYDFTRFTLGGHRRLWRWFDEIEAGVSGGPGMALAWTIGAAARTAAGGSRVGRALALVLAATAGALLTRLDPCLIRRASAFDAASATWFLGRRRETPVADREIIGRYRGAGAPAT
jgi:SAM-dependent methyltransferase